MAAPLLTTAAKQLASRFVKKRVLRGAQKSKRNLYVVGGLAAILLPMSLVFGLAGAMFTMIGGVSGSQAAAQEECAGLPDVSEVASASDGGPSTTGGTGAQGVVSSPDQLDQDQLQNAQTIIEVGKKLNVSPYGWVVALSTAMQESTLRNLDYGDRDSVGLFQQRANWGSVAERTDPVVSATFFYSGGSDAPDGVRENGLLQIEGWEQMTVTEAAQAVQISAFPNAYAQWEPLARALAEEYGDGDFDYGDCGWPPSVQCPQTPWPQLEEGLTSDARIVLRCTHQKFDEFETFYTIGERPAGGDGDHANGRAVDAMLPFDDYKSAEAKEYGWEVAKWAQANADKFGIKYIIFDKKIWSVARDPEGWRDYDHYSGCTSDTCLHYDHIHFSVYGNAARLPDTGDWVLPVPPGSYSISAEFGECGGNWENCHTGLDFAASEGTPVRAAAQGEVIFAGWNGPYGDTIKIDHGQGVVTQYSHLSDFSQDVLGKTVIPGQMVGAVGSTGNSTGPHLHFEVQLDGEPVDPEGWLEDHGLEP